MRLFKTRWFHRWARKEKLSDKALQQAIEEMDRGLVDATLGNGVYKKRIAIQSKGKRGGSRTIIAYRTKDKAFYVYGFAKNRRTNISDDELKVFKMVAAELLAHNETMLNHLVKVEELVEVISDE